MFSKRVVGYIRISTKAQLHGEGLDIQRLKIKEYCQEKGLPLDDIYEDKGISGAVKDRPGLLALLKDCENGSIQRVVVYKQDRLSRELTIALWLETQFKKYDVEVVSVVDPEYDLEDPLQKAFKRIADVFAELEKEIIATRLKEGRISNARKGKRGSGPIPFGYEKIEGKLEVQEEKAKWVKKIFKWFVRGESYSAIIRRLEKSGIKTNRGKPFSIESLKYILGNPIYFGEANFGDIKCEGKHEALISKRLFLKAKRSRLRS